MRSISIPGASHLALEIQDHWEPHIKEGHLRNKAAIREGLALEFGKADLDAKIKNFVDLGVKPLSVLASHNKFSAQVRAAFVIGGYYPALVGACTLAERILNHLVRLLKEDFRGSPFYKRVYRKDSFDNWQLPLDALESWDVLLPDALSSFHQLSGLRNRVAHFDPETDRSDRLLALEAIHLLTKIISVQFGSFGPQPWFIPGIPGAAYLRKAAEVEPFVRRVYLPNARLVGPRHEPKRMDGAVLVIEDSYEYETREISDDEFRDLLLTGPPDANA